MSEPANDAGPRVTTPARGEPESAYAWTRLFAALVLSAIGGVGMWSVIVALPAVQAEFGVARSAAVAALHDDDDLLRLRRHPDGAPLRSLRHLRSRRRRGRSCLGVGYVVASQATSLWQFALAQGLLVGVASSATFAPLIADTSLWFTRHRGMAVAIIASGSYVAGTVWPPVVQHFIETRRLALDVPGHRRLLRGDHGAAGAGPPAAVAADRDDVRDPRRARRGRRGRWGCRRPRCRPC